MNGSESGICEASVDRKWPYNRDEKEAHWANLTLMQTESGTLRNGKEKDWHF